MRITAPIVKLLLFAALVAFSGGCAVHGDAPAYWIAYANETDGYRRLIVLEYGGREATRFANDEDGYISQDEEIKLPVSTIRELERRTEEDKLEIYQADSDASYQPPYDIAVHITSKDNTTTKLYFNQGQDLTPATREFLDALKVAQPLELD